MLGIKKLSDLDNHACAESQLNLPNNDWSLEGNGPRIGYFSLTELAVLEG